MDHEIPEEKAAHLKADFRAFWNAMFVKGQDNVEPEEFVEKMAQQYEYNKEAFSLRMRQILTDCIDLFDADKEGLISNDKYIVALRSWGIDKFNADFMTDFAHSTQISWPLLRIPRRFHGRFCAFDADFMADFAHSTQISWPILRSSNLATWIWYSLQSGLF